MVGVLEGALRGGVLAMTGKMEEEGGKKVRKEEEEEKSAPKIFFFFFFFFYLSKGFLESHLTES